MPGSMVMRRILLCRCRMCGMLYDDPHARWINSTTIATFAVGGFTHEHDDGTTGLADCLGWKPIPSMTTTMPDPKPPED